jgi:hypothetical protein
MKLLMILALGLISFTSKACPQFNLRNLVCVDQSGESTSLDSISLQGNLLTFTNQGENMSLPLPSTGVTDGVTWGWKCVGQTIVDWQIIGGESIEVNWMIEGNRLIRQGYEIDSFSCENESCSQHSNVVKEFVRTECSFN